jgi:hypothetical protein
MFSLRVSLPSIMSSSNLLLRREGFFMDGVKKMLQFIILHKNFQSNNILSLFYYSYNFLLLNENDKSHNCPHENRSIFTRIWAPYYLISIILTQYISQALSNK